METAQVCSPWLLVHFPFLKDMGAEVEAWNGMAELRARIDYQAFSHQV